jgi:phage-related protein
MFKIAFFKTLAGNEPVREWIKSLPKDDMSTLGQDLMTVQFGFPLGMPLCRAMKNGLHELRVSLPSKREARVFFFQHKDYLICVHAFVKKTQKTPAKDLDLALKRKADYERNAP